MLKVVALSLAVIIVVGVVVSGAWIAVETGKYMINQNFPFGMAVQWAWADYTNMIDIWKPFYREEAEVLEFPFTNQHVDVVACTAL